MGIKKRGYIYCCILASVIFIVLALSDVAIAETYKRYELGRVNAKDNEFEFLLNNKREQTLNIKLNLVDTYDFVDVEFEEDKFELGPKESKRIRFSFDITDKLRKNPKEGMNYSFYIIPTIVNPDNSILIIKDSSSNPVSPESAIIDFSFDKDSESGLNRLLILIQDKGMNYLIILCLLGFLVYFSYQVFTYAKERRNNSEREEEKDSKAKKKKRSLFSFMKKSKDMNEQEKKQEEKENKKDTHEYQAPEEKPEKQEEPETQNKMPESYEEMVKQFVEKNEGEWTSEQFFRFLTGVSKNKIKKKIYEIKEDLEKEKEDFLKEKKNDKSQPLKDAKKEKVDIDEMEDIRKKLKQLKE